MDELPEQLYYCEEKSVRGGFTKVNNNFLLNKDIPLELKAILPQIFYHQKKYPDIVITKVKCIEITGASRRVVDQVYLDAEKLGYMQKIPLTSDNYKKALEFGYKLDQHIKNLYVWYTNPVLNPNHIEQEIVMREEDQLYTQDDLIAQLNKNLKITETKKVLTEEEKTAKKTLTKQQTAWKNATTKFEDSAFSNKPNIKNTAVVTMSPDMMAYFKKYFDYDYLVSQDSSLDELMDACWKLIVRASSNTQDSFDSFVGLDTTIKINEINKQMMLGLIYNGTDTFNRLKSKMPIIRETDKYDPDGEIDYAKALFIEFTKVIANYVRQQEFLVKEDGNRRSPYTAELKVLYYTLEAHPELICLNNNKWEYKMFDQFYKQLSKTRLSNKVTYGVE